VASPLPIEIYSDVVCPWCYLGKRRLEAALGARPSLTVELRFRAFELNPELPVEGVNRAEYLARKFGDPSRLREAHERLEALGRDVGIEFRFAAARRMPNTRRAHALAQLAGERQADMIDALFRAYFEDGQDIGDPEVLVELGRAAGLDAAAVREGLGSPATLAAIAAEERTAAELGIHGVPFFVFAGHWAVSGAQEPATLVAVLDRVVAELAARTSSSTAAP